MKIRNNIKRMLAVACALLVAAGAATADTWDTIAQRKRWSSRSTLARRLSA
ncbi:hypothetical protein LP414_05665 [Polaromonas sp. P1(28)-13]|nr:hypothetical protein LP414_05665 [Polaromonas sp. P1(28)-13]